MDVRVAIDRDDTANGVVHAVVHGANSRTSCLVSQMQRSPKDAVTG
jgi:hypothetical protein